MAKIYDLKDKSLPKNDAILKEAYARFRVVESAERFNRKEGTEDLNMLAGRGHWPADIVKKRELEDRPCLVINKLPSFVDQVMNDSRLNKLAVKVRPYGKGSNADMATKIAGIIKTIENQSNADIAYQTALESAVRNGFGYFRVITVNSDDSPWDQDIYIKRIRNPMTVYLDPNHVEHDGRDIRFGFVTEMISRDEYKARYRGKEPVPFNASEGSGDSNWSTESQVRVAEYWVKEPLTKRICLLSDGRTVDGDEWDKISDDLKANEKIIHLEPDPNNPEVPIEVEGPAPEGTDYPQTTLNPTPTIVREREIETHKVMQYLVDGEKLLEPPTEWPGRYIPIIPVYGKELVIDSEVILMGLIRFAKDPQRMYNYFRTAATETVALTPKAPYIVEEGQVEGLEDDWDNIGKSNPTHLKYKYVPNVPPPSRQLVTQTAIGEITESNLANDEMKATTSLHDASMGARSNEVSGKAILARQREGDVANFHFHDNLKRAVKFCGDILLDLIPRIYDTERQIVITNEMDEEEMITFNQSEVDIATGETIIINDLSSGRYKAVVTAGPSFTTQRIEAAESMLDFVRTAPNTAAFVMDLIAEVQDWPGALKIAKRLKKLLPPGIDDDGPAQPQEPSPDDVLKGLKANSINLGNEMKKLNIVKTKRELVARDQTMIKAGAAGAMGAMGFPTEGGETSE